MLHSGTLVIVENGLVKAQIQVGNLIADGKVELRSTGTLRGDVLSKTLVVHDGATFQGRCYTLLK